MIKWLKTQSKDFCAEGMQKPVFQWEKCVLKNIDFIENKAIFPGLNVSCFIAKLTLLIKWFLYIYIYIYIS